MVTCHKLVLMEESTPYAATIGNSQAIGELSYATFITHESVHAIVKGSSRYVWR